MGTITNTSYPNPTRYPSQSYIDRRKQGVGAMYYLKRVSSTVLGVWNSDDNGASWSDLGINFTRANMVETSGIFVGLDGHIHILYRVYEGGSDKVYYRRRVSGSATWDAEKKLLDATAASSGLVYSGMDLVVLLDAATGINYMIAAVGANNGTNSGVVLSAATIAADGTVKLKSSLITGKAAWYNSSGRQTPSIDFRHTGDGKTSSSNPSLWVSWGRSNVYCVQLPWVAGPSWSGPSSPVTIYTVSPNQDYTTGRYNAVMDRFAVSVYNASTVVVIERRAGNYWYYLRTTPTHPAGVVKHQCLAVHSVSGDYRVFAVGTSDNRVYQCDYSQKTGTYTAWQLTLALDTLTLNNFGARRNTFGTGAYELLTTIDGGAAPYNVVFTKGASVTAPKTPVLATPASGAAADVTIGLPFAWSFVDDDPADSQSAYALKRQIGGGAAQWWQAGTATWVGSETFNTSGTNAVTLSTGWGTDADDTHSYSVAVKDQTPLASGYSVPVQVIPSTKSDPVITTPLNFDVLAFANLTIVYTVGSQSARRIKLKQSGVTRYDSGWVTTDTTTFAVPYSLVTGASYTIELTTRNSEGLTSNTITVGITTSFVPPPQPVSVTLTPDSTLGVITIAVVNGTPTGVEPEITGQDLYRRVIGQSGDGVKVASAILKDGTYSDFTAASDIGYEYRFALLGTNGTIAYTIWTS